MNIKRSRAAWMVAAVTGLLGLPISICFGHPRRHGLSESHVAFNKVTNRSITMHYLRRTLITTSVFTLSLTAPLTAQWVRQSPLPYQPLDAESVTFATPTHGYIAGSDIAMGAATFADDFLLETQDGGQTWAPRHFPGTQQNFRCVFFVDALHGWVVGNSTPAVNDNFRTVDGGLTWQQIQLPFGTWTTVHFLDPNFGWAKSLGGPPALSTDGGLTWEYDFPNAGLLASLAFFNPQFGIAMSGSGIWRTTDGAASWTQVLAGDFMHSPKFLSASVLVVGVFPTGLMRSIDGGLTWNTVPGPAGQYIDIEAFTPDIAIAATGAGEVIRTTDAGATWSPVNFPLSFIDIRGIDLINETTAIRLWDSSGDVVITTDAGATWTVAFNGPRIPMRAVAFGSATHGVVAGLDGLILGTSDGGATWDYLSNGMAEDLRSIGMFDAQRGLAVGKFGVVLRTQDGGEHWIPSRPVLTALNDIQVIGDQIAVAVGDAGRVIKTIDGGLTWTSLMMANGQFDLLDVEFINENEGWAIGGPEAIIFHTVDGGATWTSQFFSGGFSLRAVSFVDADHGWAAGPIDGILWTADGGSSWTVSSIFNPPGGPDPKWDIRFVNHNVGWVVGNFGYIAKSTDGGLTWVNHDIAATEHIISIHVVNEQELWAATFNGRVHHSTDGGVTWTQVSTGFESDPSLGFDFVTATPSGDLWVVGAFGTILKRPTASVSGDINGDGLVDVNDVPPFVAVLLGAPLDPAHVARADVNGDGATNGLDVREFIAFLTGA